MPLSYKSLSPYQFHRSEQHPFHLVNPSPWPLFVAFNAFQLTTSFVLYMNRFDYSFFLLCFSFLSLVFTVSRWFTDVVVEATFEGHHNAAVRRGLSLGMILFIVSEIMFFFSFFWAFFHFSLAPSISIGGVWPPKNLEDLNPTHIPLLNTVLLLSSGVSVTYAHRAIVSGYREHTTLGLIVTVFYGLIFTGFQGYEYVTAPFSINDSVYGSVFYMATGFHGFHVLIGTIFLIFCLLRHLNYHFDTSQHVGFEAAAWYWHFVDVVWLFLYITIYCWGFTDWGSVFPSNLSLLSTVELDFPTPWQLNFQTPGNTLLKLIIDLHNQIMCIEIIILCIVFYIMLFIAIYFKSENTPLNPQFMKNEHTFLEIFWTTIPAIILVFISIPSFLLLYVADNLKYPKFTLKVIGRQWYWSYNFHFFSKYYSKEASTVNSLLETYKFNDKSGQIFDNLESTNTATSVESNSEQHYLNFNFQFDNYMVASDDLIKGDLRLMETDKSVYLPRYSDVRILVSSGDVLHSWAIPSLAIKIDACPGRLNQIPFRSVQEGLFYGQCSEICGVGHAFMPIMVNVLNPEEFRRVVISDFIDAGMMCSA